MIEGSNSWLIFSPSNIRILLVKFFALFCFVHQPLFTIEYVHPLNKANWIRLFELEGEYEVDKISVPLLLLLILLLLLKLTFSQI